MRTIARIARIAKPGSAAGALALQGSAASASAHVNKGKTLQTQSLAQTRMRLRIPKNSQKKHGAGQESRKTRFFGHFGFGRAPKSECPLLGHWNEGITNRMPKTSEKLDTLKPNYVTSSGMFCFFFYIISSGKMNLVLFRDLKNFGCYYKRR